jgi:GntR family transcriptional regulator, transcriptional repressor for pyruvate dehydrogenase complex
VYDQIEPIRLYEIVVERLQELVISGQLKVGDRLPSELDLARQFGVSRTAIREAIGSLVEQGIVVVRPGSGTYVSRADGRPLQRTLSWLARVQGEAGDDYLAELRHLLEPGVCALAAERATEEQISEMNSALEDAHRARTQPEEFIDADLRFHRLLAEASHNPLVGALLDSIGDLLRNQRIRYYIASSGNSKNTERNHRKILDLVVQRRPAEAYRAMQDHLQQVIHDAERTQSP